MGGCSRGTRLGYAYHHLGRHHEAVDCHRHALALCRDLGARYEEATILGHLGGSLRATGDPAAAAAVWTQALDILTDLDHPKAGRFQDKIRGLERLVRLDNPDGAPRP